MNDKLPLDPKTSALLVMDFQVAIVEGPAVPGDAGDKAALLARTAGLLVAARKAGVRVVYVVVGFRPGYPEVSPRNKSFSAIRGTGRFIEGSAGSEIHAAVAARPEDIVVTKHRARSVIDASPRPSRSSTLRRVTSERAANVLSSRAGEH